jgi:hypothetical protein
MRCKAEVACVQFQLQFQFSFSFSSASLLLSVLFVHLLLHFPWRTRHSAGVGSHVGCRSLRWDLLFTIYYLFTGAFALSLDSERALCSLCFLLRSGVTLFPAREADKLCVEACCNLALALAWLFASHGYVRTSWTMTQPNATHAR